MSEKHLICHGAMCECEQGFMPDKLLVSTQTKHYINDSGMSEKLIATNKEIGQPFENNTFGNCKLQPTPSGYKPCQPIITEWTGMYESVTFEENGGNPLLEDSKATCVIAGAPCIEITFHGQIAEVGQQNVENSDEDTLAALNPMIPMKEKAASNIDFKIK
ncbi:DUF4280 domain-containing protein [Tenacibaculum finnmarkense genomovar ulcerans]|uniref:DUF4280 domain-containing protein n=1 Tax=Tenacibaculum finnmarkense TaxID=2781243 RepID=UPI00187B8262|nr:DUF4280 domain-containing protein [Tenacibaculum finnmarkense]MBE7635093.1 DUF4280 domain-containing protein [Tenacibaculum finnmarkense genomovar ulcerans]MCD8401316.1 DUF4280 domain-containing protein [Tenacibaculum finnmarkense genomovar ulcerans]MCD8403858.1 DUF4280 domain-containing protein [Tenacibaculum finnmarkense genomovar finnmarkense]MCD8431027.1 DUF4280 domain-containing protein [Tenacibaculum finnmarkense genomovar ulcerans]MCD8433503.1 DUF4280 domain-containing protein [Tenac